MRIAQLLQQGFQQYAEPVMLFLKVVHDNEDCPDDCLKAAAGVRHVQTEFDKTKNVKAYISLYQSLVRLD